MNMKRLCIAGIMVGLLFIGLSPFISCAEKPELEVLTGTSLIADIVKDISGGKIGVRNIIPPGSCPGHYDVKPGDIEAVAKGKIFLIHEWQQHQENIKGLIKAANNPALTIKVIEVKGNWMTPPVQAEAVTKISAVLMEIDKANSAYYSRRAEERKRLISIKEKEVRSKLNEAKISGMKVVCADMQAGFVRWVGFDIVATYGRPEELTPAKIAEVITKAKAAGVALVIDNFQSGPEAGKGIAKDIGAVQVTLSNFPGGFKGTDTWEKALDRNIELLVEAVNKYRKTKAG